MIQTSQVLKSSDIFACNFLYYEHHPYLPHSHVTWLHASSEWCPGCPYNDPWYENFTSTEEIRGGGEPRLDFHHHQVQFCAYHLMSSIITVIITNHFFINFIIIIPSSGSESSSSWDKTTVKVRLRLFQHCYHLSSASNFVTRQGFMWCTIIIIITRPKPAYDRRGLAGHGAKIQTRRESFGVFSTSHFAPRALHTARRGTLQTWDLSKNLHDRIFKPNILHTSA